MQRSTHSLTTYFRGLSEAVAVRVRPTRRQNPNPVLSGISPNFRKFATGVTTIHTNGGNIVDRDVRMGPSSCLAEGKKVLKSVVFGFHEANRAKARFTVHEKNEPAISGTIFRKRPGYIDGDLLQYTRDNWRGLIITGGSIFDRANFTDRRLGTATSERQGMAKINEMARNSTVCESKILSSEKDGGARETWCYPLWHQRLRQTQSGREHHCRRKKEGRTVEERRGFEGAPNRGDKDRCRLPRL